ncbi:class I SAM-dependent methyltransferase [Gymnodinialimonas sp.]
MAYDYDKLYGETRDALGEPTPIFTDFFDRFEKQNARILDVGCGQGRDAIFIARKGHRVVGVDLSANGIRDLQRVAKKEGLSIEGIVADIATFTPNGVFNVVLIDRTLHMLDGPSRRAVLGKMLDHVAKGGWLLIADEASNVEACKTVAAEHEVQWQVEVSRRGYLFLRHG